MYHFTEEQRKEIDEMFRRAEEGRKNGTRKYHSLDESMEIIMKRLENLWAENPIN